MKQQQATGKQQSMRGYVSACAVFFSGLLMIASKLGISVLVSFLDELVFSKWIFEEWETMLLEMAFYFLMLLPSALFLLIFFRSSPFGMFKEKPNVPNLPFLYIPLVLGLLYGFNFVVNLIFGNLFDPFDPVPTASDFPNTAAGIALYFVYSSICPAILEEWLFRGIAMRNLLPFGNGFAVLVSSLFFGFMHSSPSQTLFATAFGLIAGYTYLKTGSVWFGMLIHFLNNCISTGVSYWTIVFEETKEDVTFYYGGYVLLCMLFSVITIGFYIASVSKQKKKLLEKENHTLTRSQQVKAVLLNPLFYLMIAGYVFLIWLDYSARGAV